jgi:uncharacterized protein (DUF427 family)
MVKAVWNGKLIAETDRTEIVEGNHYFPSEALRWEFFQPSDAHTICPWKGKAHYYTVLVDGKENTGTEWYYSQAQTSSAENGRQSCLLERRSDRDLIIFASSHTAWHRSRRNGGRDAP